MMKILKLNRLKLGLLIVITIALSACGSSVPSTDANSPDSGISGLAVGTASDVALREWKGDVEVEQTVNYQDYVDLLIQRSRVKKEKAKEDSPRVKQEKQLAAENEKKESKNPKDSNSELSFGLETQSGNTPLLMTHYMPWFQSQDVSGYWGIHWTMNNCDPNIIDSNGRREICAHHYPLIGPYDTSDPDLHEYHALLMHLSGIDGVIIDWYGTMNHFDWPIIRDATEAFIDALDRYDLKYVIMYEDKTIEAALYFNLIQDGIAAAQADLAYLETNFFSRPNYLHINNQPLLLNFGPSHFETATEWQQIFTNQQVQPYYQGLWAVDNFKDEFFAWVYDDSQFLPWFYQTSDTENWTTTIGEAYPMFDDYYFEGGWGDNLFELDDLNGQRFSQTLQQAANEGVDIIQLNTWNDFGEGTDIEPSIENGYQYLVDLQTYTGSAFTQDDLEAATEFYFLRKQISSAGLSLQASDSYVDTEAVRQLIEQGNEQDARKLMTQLSQ